MLSVLRHRDFGLLWVAGLVSVTGDWVLNAALPYFVYQQTGSTLATAGMTVAELVPGVLLSSPAGVFVDRWDRRRVLLVTNLLQALAVTLLLLCASGNALWAVYVVGWQRPPCSRSPNRPRARCCRAWSGARSWSPRTR